MLFLNKKFFLNLYSALYFSASLLPEVQGVILEPQIQPRLRRAFDVRGPLSPLNPWRQNIQLLERVGRIINKWVLSIIYLGLFIGWSVLPFPFYSVVNSLGSYMNQVGLQSVF
jgi:hypothetical protein